MEEYIKDGQRFIKKTDENGNIYIEAYCIKCGGLVGRVERMWTDPKTMRYCHNCVKEFIVEVPFDLTEKIEVVKDMGHDVVLRYHDNGAYTYNEMYVEKTCYFNTKGRYVKVQGKTFHLNNRKKEVKE